MIGYKGFFQYRRVLSEGLTEQIMSYAEEILENHQNMLHKDIKDAEIDYYFSTYNVNDQLDALYVEKLKKKCLYNLYLSCTSVLFTPFYMGGTIKSL